MIKEANSKLDVESDEKRRLLKEALKPYEAFIKSQQGYRFDEDDYPNSQFENDGFYKHDDKVENVQV